MVVRVEDGDGEKKKTCDDHVDSWLLNCRHFT